MKVIKPLFKNRKDAAMILLEKLKNHKNQSDTIILALPRGGVPIASILATGLNLPLHLCLVRKLGVPSHKELAMGAIAKDDTIYLNKTLIALLNIQEKEIANVINEEQKELARRTKVYQDNWSLQTLTDKTVIVVDDGVATGATLHAAIMIIKKYQPKKIIVALPIAAQESFAMLKKMVDEIICIGIPKYLNSVGEWYEQFDQVSDQEVLQLMARHHHVV